MFDLHKMAYCLKIWAKKLFFLWAFLFLSFSYTEITSLSNRHIFWIGQI